MDINTVLLPEILPAVIEFTASTKADAHILAQRIGYTVNNRNNTLTVPVGKKALFQPIDLKKYNNCRFQINENIGTIRKLNSREYVIDYQCNGQLRLNRYFIGTLLESIPVPENIIVLNEDNYYPQWNSTITTANYNSSLTEHNATGSFIQFMTYHTQSETVEKLVLTFIENWVPYALHREQYRQYKILLHPETHSEITVNKPTIKSDIFMDMKNGSILRKTGETTNQLIFEDMLSNKMLKIKHSTIEMNRLRLLPITPENSIVEYVIRTLKESWIATEKFSENRIHTTSLNQIFSI